jgi:hypothetical protein
MNEVIKTPGTHIAYETTSKSIIFGEDEDLSINLKNREQDEKTTVDICSDNDGFLVVGTAAGLRYVAQVEIPARQYTETEQANPNYDPEAEAGTEAANQTITTREPVPFDIDNCTIYLWGMEE